jgi:EmrB/QacA subfamily drug resistance transporter
MSRERTTSAEPEIADGKRIDAKTRRLIYVLVLGMVAPALDTTIVNVALPALGRGLHTSVSSSQWTITGYLLALGMAMPITRWLSERFGQRRVWVASLAAFLLGSALAGAAWNIESLIAFRLLQGGAAGLMFPLVTTIITVAAGRERLGRVASIAMMVVVVVPIFGPVVGGLVVKYLGWRWVFYVNPPICLIAGWLAWRTLPEGPRRAGRSLDLVGLALLSPGLALVIYGLSRATGIHGFALAGAWVPLLIGFALTAAFTFHAVQRRSDPLIDVRLLRIRSYAASTSVLFLAGFSVYGPLLLLSLYYQQVQGCSVLATGLLLAPQGIGSLIPRGIAGRLTDRIGSRPVVIVGLLLTILGTLAFAWAGPNTSLWLLAASLFVRGAGLAPVTIAVQAGAFREIKPGDVPDASSTTRIVQQVGGSFGAAVLTLILVNATAHHEAITAAGRGLAFNAAFWWAIAVAALTFLPALLLPAGVSRENDRIEGGTGSRVPRSTRRRERLPKERPCRRTCLDRSSASRTIAPTWSRTSRRP